ncbi:hypothetical protein, conserved [Leishmania donovani]|uniref:Uncharacterized protein n=1 Tax=Leishmania donovani TaxID=5661 RepID=E9B8F7_LEIDO|nr:hypothetical protein, conserved [Leishmania donovani]CBZ31530.1 hypothetical protein, conserved [Leishmania donovani]
MEDDAAAETTSIDFSLAPSNGSGDVAGGSPTESPPSDDNEIMRAGRGAVHHPMPAIQVPKPTRPQPPTSPAPFGDEAADGGAPLPVASPASAHVAKPITPFQAIRPAGLRRKGHLVRPSLKRDASLDFVRAVQQLDSEDFQRSRSRSSDSEGLDDDSDHSGNGASAKRRCRQGAAGDAINEGERTTQAWAQSPSPTAPSRQLLVPPQQPTRASNVTATTTTLIATTADETINFEAEKNDGADDTMAAPVVAAAPASRTSAVEQAALPLPQEQHQRPGTALTPSTKARATAHESPPPLSSTTTGTAPSKDISGPKPQTPTSPPAQQPRNEQRRSSPSWSRHTSPGYTVSAATAATTTGAADIVGATLPTASPASPGRIALPDAGPQHHTPHLRLLSSSMQNEDDPMYCTVSEMTMANPVTPRGGVSLPLLGLSTGLQQARGASGGSLYLSPARPSLRPAAASRRVQSSDFSLDESNALLTLNTPREVVKSATAAPKESTYFRDAAFEDGAELASTSTPSQSMLGLHGKPLPSFVQPALVKRTADGRTTAGDGRLSQPAPPRQLQHPSAPPAIIAELKRHAEREKEDEKEHTLRPTSTPSPRETRVGGGGAHREHRSASSIFKSFPSKTICGHSRSSVAAKSGVDKHGEGGGEGRDVKTSGRSTSSIQSTRSSSLASGLSRLSSMFKRLVSGAGHGSVDVKTQRPLQPSSSSSQQQRRTRQHEDNAATTTAVAASLQMSTLGNTVKTTDSSTNPRSADTLVGCKQRQPPPAVTPAAASATAVKPGRATPKREITSSWHGDSINFPTDEEEDRGRGDGVAGVAPLIPPAAAAPAVPVEGASGGAEESQGRRKRKDAERPDRRRRRRRLHDAEAQDGASLSASAAGGDDRRSSGSGSAGDVDTSSSSTPLTSASGAEKPRRRCRERGRRSGPRRHRHRREGRKQQKEQANGVSKFLQDRPSSPTPPLKSQSSDRSASSDGRLDRSSRRLSQRGCRQRCDANDRGLAASVKALASRKASQRHYRRALRGDGESSRTFRRPCEGARHHNATNDNSDRGDPDGSSSRDCHGDAVPPLPPPIASAAILAARRRELRAKSRVTSSVNHFAVSWRTRPTTRHRQELLSHAGRASLARLPKRDAERKSGSAKAAVVAAEAVAASRRASGSQLWAGSRRSAVKSRQSGTAPFPPRLLTPGRLEQYEAALRRDIRELDVIVEERRRRELWAAASPAAAAAAAAVATPSRQPLRGAAQRRAMATPALTAGPLPSRVGITTVATASTPAPKRRSSAGNTRAAHRCHGPIVSARLSHPNDYGSSKANEVESAAVDGRGGRDDSSPAPHTPRTATAPSQSASSSLFRIRTAAGVRGQPQQRPSASASYTSHTSKADSVLAAVRRPGATDSGNDDAEAAPHHSSSTQLPGDATCFAMMALQRRYEQLLEDLVAQSAPQPPATSEIDEGGNATDDEVSMKAHWRHNYSARRHQYPHQHLSREQVEGERNRGVASSSSTRGRRSAPAPTQVDATMEAEVARCAAALRAEYYQPPQRQQNQQQEPSTIMERASLPHATHEAGADTASVAHVAASYAQALRPSCAACRPQQLNEYMTLGLLSMMHRGADECVDTAAVAASENAANLRQAHARPVTAPTLVQRRIREDLYAAPRRCSRRRMTQAGGKQKAACSDGNTAAAPPITSVSASCGAVLSSMHAQSADAAAAGRDVGLSPQAGTAPLPPAQLTHFFTPTPVVIDGALLTRLMRRERHARRERVSKEQEARHTLQRLYIVETILVLRAMGKAAATQEQEAPAAPALPTSQTLGGAATAPVNDRGGKRSGSRSPLAATRSSRDASVEDDGGATREPVVATVSVSQQPREEASASEEEHAAAAAVVVCGDAAAASAPLPMGDTTARPLAGDASEMRNEVEVATGERDADDSSSSSASPAVLVTPSPQAAAATEVGGEVKHAKDHGGDVDLAESSSSNRSASSVLSFHVEDSQEGAALQHPGPGADGADKGHYPVVASGSSAAAIPAAAAQLSSDESTSSVTAAVDDLAIPPTASPQAAQARPLSIDRGEPITDSDRHGTLDDIDGAAGTVDYAPDGHAAASPPSAGKHTNAASHRYPPPVPSSCSAASAAPSSPSRNLHVVEVVEAARAAVLVPEGEGAVDASHSTGDAGSTGVEVVARDALQSSVTPVEATASTALASAAAAEAIPESEPPASAEDDPRRALEGPQPWKREQRQQQKMATVTTCTAVPASPRRVRFSLQPEVVSGDDGEVKEFSDASKQTCWEGRETSHAAGGPQTMTPEPFKRAAVDKDGLAIDLLEKLNGLDALLLYSFPTYFTTGTDEDGLPGVVMRPHRHPPSASPSVQPRWWRSPLASTPFVSPRPLQPYRSAPSRHLSDSMSPLAEGRETPPSSAADAAAADASPFDAHASALRGHRTPPRLPPESLASQLRRKYGLPQPVQQRRHDHSAEFTLGLPATATPSVAAAAPTPPSASVSGSWPSAVPAAERPSLQEGIDTPHLAVRRSVWF